MSRISPHSVRMLIRSVVPEDMQISSAAVDKLISMMESYLEEIVEIYGEVLVHIAVQNACAEGRNRLMPHHFDQKIAGARQLVRPALGQYQITSDAMDKLVSIAETEILTEVEINKIRQAGVIRAKATLIRRTAQAVERAKARGARRVTIDDVAD